jgi:hypothetical protein
MSDLVAFCQFCAGTPRTYDLGGGNTAVRIVPLSHPATSQLVCRKLSSRATGGWTPTNPAWSRQWSHAKVKVGFETVPWTSDGASPFLVVNAQSGSETYTLAGVRLTFPDGSPVQADAGQNVPTTIYQATIYQAASLGDDVWAPLSGKVNASAIQIGSYLCPAGTVRFDGGGGQQVMTANFQSAYTRQLAFAFRPIPWNQFLRPNGVWDTPLKPGGVPVYEAGDFSPLFA